MRSFVIVLALASVTSCKNGVGALASLVAFEGKIDMTVTMPISPTSTLMTSYEVKGKKIRTETKGVIGVVNITDTDAKKSWLIDDAARTYYEIDLEKAIATSKATAATSKARSLGKSDKVAGYSCDLWEVADTTMRAEVCVASGLSMIALGLSGPFSMFAKGGDAWSEVMSRGFPLRMVMSDASGAVMMKMEATRIEKKSLPDSEFQVPAGYTKTASPI